MLVGFRALQGIAGAVLVPSTMGIIVAVFGERERAAAIGSWTAWTGIATVVGPLAGGVLVQAASWRWVFLINLPLAVATIALTLRAMPDDRPAPERRPRVDFKGAALAALGLAGPVFALIEQPLRGWGDPLIWGPLVAGVVLLAVFVVVEQRERDPMVPMDLFKRRNFAWGNLATLAMYAGLGILFFFLVLFLQQVAGYTPIQAGVALLPVTILMFLLSKRFGGLADRYGPRWFMTIGPFVGAIGLTMMLRLDVQADYWTQLLPGLVVFGIGLSATVAPLTAAVLGGVEVEHAGIASGINNAIARVAGLLAVAVAGVFVSSQFSSTLDEQLAGVRLTPSRPGGRDPGQGQAAGRHRAGRRARPGARRGAGGSGRRLAQGLPRVDRPRRRPRARRWRDLARRRPRSAPRGLVRGLRRRPAGRRSGGGRAGPPGGAPAASGGGGKIGA